jgi:hypothetical protein
MDKSTTKGLPFSGDLMGEWYDGFAVWYGDTVV